MKQKEQAIAEKILEENPELRKSLKKLFSRAHSDSAHRARPRGTPRDKDFTGGVVVPERVLDEVMRMTQEKGIARTLKWQSREESKSNQESLPDLDD